MHGCTVYMMPRFYSSTSLYFVKYKSAAFKPILSKKNIENVYMTSLNVKYISCSCIPQYCFPLYKCISIISYPASKMF